MAQKPFDTLRALAIASQAIGLMLIITFETALGDNARLWQGITLALMIAAALWIALLRLYRRNKRRKRQLARQQEDE
ncbi:hypothetical protein HLB35_04485 [Halomonas sp. TBZ9]|uniref:Uncharacterized protein n=1 Tax=Vreelandella azerica TaxID=2732867 RepID=A0A7Y3TXE4_9GAMM|nr:hypothetical protein [Halomonas azerica]NOG31207.1 hypothetical protein [Halomonas azerica]